MIQREKIPIRIIDTDRISETHTEEYAALAASLDSGGQQVPIVILHNGTLIDGRRRLDWLISKKETKVDAYVVTTFEDACEALAANHQVPVDRIRRVWEIHQVIEPLILERTRRIKRRPRPRGRIYNDGDVPVPGLRDLLRKALGGYVNVDKILTLYKAAEEGVAKAVDLVDLMERDELTIHQAYAQFLARRTEVSIHFVRDVVKAGDQKKLLENSLQRLEAISMGMRKLGPIKMSKEDRQLALKELRAVRSSLYSTIRLLEEAGQND